MNENPQNEIKVSANNVADRRLVPRILTLSTHNRQPVEKSTKDTDISPKTYNEKILDIFSHQGN